MSFGHQLHLSPHFTVLLILFYPSVKICEIDEKSFSITHKNKDPSPLQVQKSNRMKYDSQTKWVSSPSIIIRHQTHTSLKSLQYHQCPPPALN